MHHASSSYGTMSSLFMKKKYKDKIVIIVVHEQKGVFDCGAVKHLVKEKQKDGQIDIFTYVCTSVRV